MKLEEIGFYTLSDQRAKHSSVTSQLMRCEMILTDKCTFKCPYCRGVDTCFSGSVPFEDAQECLSLWIKDGLKNVRFSGGEPTLYPRLIDLVKMCKDGGVEHIAISTNGFSKQEIYQKLIDAGVNDFSVSLDACCASMGDNMAGGIPGAFQKVIENIRFLSQHTYITVGIVFTEENIGQAIDTVMFANSLGVSDIRVIPSAQYNQGLARLGKLPSPILKKYKILQYRIKNVEDNIPVRGLSENHNKCRLVLDDMAVAGGASGLRHFPCIIYFREGGKPIGKVGPNMRQEREEWMLSHDPCRDKICSKNCLDVCVAYNNVANNALRQSKKGKQE